MVGGKEGRKDGRSAEPTKGRGGKGGKRGRKEGRKGVVPPGSGVGRGWWPCRGPCPSSRSRTAVPVGLCVPFNCYLSGGGGVESLSSSLGGGLCLFVCLFVVEEHTSPPTHLHRRRRLPPGALPHIHIEPAEEGGEDRGGAPFPREAVDHRHVLLVGLGGGEEGCVCE